jgi:hypothetical protein
MQHIQHVPYGDTLLAATILPHSGWKVDQKGTHLMSLISSFETFN